MAHASLNRLVKSGLIAQQRAIGEMARVAQSEHIEAQVYIGLNDSETRQQERDTESYVDTLKKVCVEHGVPFSFDLVNGGYIHDDGEYTEETSIVLTFIDVDQDMVDLIAEELCTLFNQESVMITLDRVKVRNVSKVK